jgi:hypothetical protein
VPDSDLARKTFKDTFPIGLNWKISPFTLRTFITLARANPLHQANLASKRERHLLMPTAYTKYRLRRIANHIESTGEGVPAVQVPRVTLTAEDDV